MGAVWSKLFETALAAVAKIAAAGVGPLSGSKMGLYISNTVITPDTLKADLTLFTVTATPEQAVTWGVPYYRQAGGEAMNTGLITWQLNAPTPTLIYGIYIVDTTAAFLYIAEPFPNGPIQLVDESSAILVSAECAFGSSDLGTMILGN